MFTPNRSQHPQNISERLERPINRQTRARHSAHILVSENSFKRSQEKYRYAIEFYDNT